MENAKEILEALPENELIILIEKVMPMSGTYRQIDERGNWSDGQINTMAELFVNSIDWEQGLEMEEICVHDKTYIVNGESDLGNKYEAIGYYSDDTLLFIQDLEFLTNEN